MRVKVLPEPAQAEMRVCWREVERWSGMRDCSGDRVVMRDGRREVEVGRETFI